MAFITLLFAFGGNVHAANDLDGKAVLCPNYAIGFVFDKGHVTAYTAQGYEIKKGTAYQYYLVGTNKVKWGNLTLDRRSLIVGTYSPCKISTKQKIMEYLKDSIANAKKRNKI